MPAQVKNFGAVGNFCGRVSRREFRHAALVVPADFHDFFERGREVAQVALVLAFEGAPCRVDGEVVRAFLARGLVIAGDFADVRANRSGILPENGHVVAVHREAILVQVDSGDFQACRQEETVSAHAAAQVVNGTFIWPKACFPTPDILCGALLQCEFVAQEEHAAGILVFCRFAGEKFLAELGHERHVVHDGGAILVAVTRLVECGRDLQCIPLAREGFFDKVLNAVGCEQIPWLHGINLHFF